MRYQLLGDVRVETGGVAHAVPSTRQRVLLATLLLSAGTPVPARRLVEIAWACAPPVDPARSLRTHIYRLRRWLRRLTAPYPQATVATAAGGYVATVAPGGRDIDEFRQRVRQARAAGAGAAVAEYRAALRLWHGPALADARTVAPGLEPAAAELDGERRATAAELAQAAAGRELAELIGWATEQPTDDLLCGLLMAALYRAGRRADALAVFDAARRAPAVARAPGEELVRIHRAVLLDRHDDPALALPIARGPQRPAPPPPPPVDDADLRLPPRCATLLDRRGPVRRATAALAGGARVLTIAGMAGVGKTTLAVHLAHAWAADHPDGCYVIDLGGFSPTPLPVAGALSRLLRALGTEPDRIPADPEERASLYRSTLAGRRLLLVLDNARDESHVRPLLPGSPEALTLITSRSLLSGLAGAHRVPLTVPSTVEALALLDALAPPDAAPEGGRRELVELCGRLPLAIRIVARQIAHHGQSGVDDAVRRLSAQPLSTLADAGTGVQLALDLSYRALAPQPRRVLRAFGLLGGVPLDAELTAALTGLPPAVADSSLEALVDVSLVEPSGRAGRYRVHDLIARYAAERGRAEDGAAWCERAQRAGLGWLLDHALAAVALASPSMARLPADADAAVSFPDRAAALDWLDAHRPTLVAAVRAAASHGHHDLAVRLADALRGYCYLRRFIADWLEVARIGLASARRTGDGRHLAAMHASLGLAFSAAARYDESLRHYAEALSACDADEWSDGVAAILGNAGMVYDQMGDLGAAYHHYDRALTLNRARGNRAGEAVRLGNLGGIHRYRGELGRARGAYEAALAAYREVGATDGHALMLVNLGGIGLDLGDPATAAERAREALALYRESGSRLGRCLALMLLSAAEGEAGRADESLRLAVEALALARALTDPRLEVDALNAVGAAERRVCHHTPAYAHHDDAARLATAIGFQSGRIEALIGIAESADAGQAELAVATAAGQAALATARSLGYGLLTRRAAAALSRLGAAATP